MLAEPRLRAQHLLALSWTHIPAPADSSLLSCLCGARGPAPSPTGVGYQAAAGNGEVTLALPVPLFQCRHGAFLTFPQCLPPTPSSCSTWWGVCWEFRDEQGNKGGSWAEEARWSGRASMGWWGQEARCLPFPEVKLGQKLPLRPELGLEAQVLASEQGHSGGDRCCYIVCRQAPVL